MGRKEKVSINEKLEAIEDYLSGARGSSQICSNLQVNKSTLMLWLRKYHSSGKDGLTAKANNKLYPESIKLIAVNDYLEGKASLRQICSMYEISSNSLLRQWIKKYNGHIGFKYNNTQGDHIMTKGRKTTYEERVEIVAFCVSNNDNYQLASEQFKVSYQQVYTWVQKYRKSGYEALSDKRGKRKSTEELSEVTVQLKLLEAENRRLKMENDFLKKLDEVERRRERAEHSKKTNT